MSINVNKAGYPTETTAPSNTSNTSGKTITNIPVGQSTENEHLKELYAKLGVTKEQFEKLCKSYPGFENMTFDEQLKIVNDNFKIETSEQKTSATQTVSNTSANTESNSSVEQSRKRRHRHRRRQHRKRHRKRRRKHRRQRRQQHRKQRRKILTIKNFQHFQKKKKKKF